MKKACLGLLLIANAILSLLGIELIINYSMSPEGGTGVTAAVFFGLCGWGIFQELRKENSAILPDGTKLKGFIILLFTILVASSSWKLFLLFSLPLLVAWGIYYLLLGWNITYPDYNNRLIKLCLIGIGILAVTLQFIFFAIGAHAEISSVSPPSIAAINLGMFGVVIWLEIETLLKIYNIFRAAQNNNPAGLKSTE